MAQVFRLKPDTYSTETLATTADQGYVYSTEIDNSTERWSGLWGYLDADFTVAPATSKWVHIAIMTRKVDGTNSDDNVPTVYQRSVVASLHCRGTDTTQKWAFHIDKLPPTKFTLGIFNSSGQQMADTTELQILLYTTEIASS